VLYILLFTRNMSNECCEFEGKTVLNFDLFLKNLNKKLITIFYVD